MDGTPVGGRPPDEIDVIGALAEPNRRALYDYVAGRRAWVGREEAAEALGLRRGTVAHHLDRLADENLLEVAYHRLTDRSGPGAGRPAKVYRRAGGEVGVSLPPRHYELAGELLAAAAERALADGTPIDTAVAEAAGAAGRRIGAGTRARLGRRASAAARQEAVLEDLGSRGFEPETRPDGVTVLHNCPFHLLARAHTQLICGMNLCLLDAVLDEVGGVELRAALEPEPGSCCVRLHPAV